jgi:hypothetical protein
MGECWKPCQSGAAVGEVEHVLVLSTAHVTANDLRLIEERGQSEACPIGCADYREGAWVVVPSDGDENDALREFGFSESFVKAVDYARGRWVPYLRLDRDGDLIECTELDTHDW